MSKKIIGIVFLIILLMSMPISFAYNTTTYRNTTTISNNTKETESLYTNNETGYKVVIEDDADLLTDSEEAKLKTQLIELTQYGHIAFKTIDKNSYGSTSSFASNYYHNTFGKESGTVFIIDMAKRMVYIFSDGANYKTVTTGKAETITDNIYTYAKKKQYYECAKEAFSQIYTILEGGKIAEPMKNVSNALIAIMISLFVNFIIFRSVTKTKSVASGELLKECENYFEHTPVEVTETGEHRVYSPIESSSGGGGGFSGGGRRRWKQRRWRWPQLLRGRKVYLYFLCIKNKQA